MLLKLLQAGRFLLHVLVKRTLDNNPTNFQAFTVSRFRDIDVRKRYLYQKLSISKKCWRAT